MPEPAGPRVLFADDDPILHRLLEMNFRLIGIEVEAVARGDEALRRAIEAPPDAVILDATMPGLSGHEVYRRLRAEPALAETPVVFLTGRSADEFATYEDERVDVVTKPFDMTALVELVERAIEARA